MSFTLSSQAQNIQSLIAALMDYLAGLPEQEQAQYSVELAQISDRIKKIITTCGDSEASAKASMPQSTNLEVQNEALEAERDRLRALVESMTDEVWYCDLVGNVTMMNDRIVQNLGLESVEDLNLPIHEIVNNKLEIYRPDGTPRPEAEAPQIRSLQGETVHGQEMIRHLKTGELRYREYASAPIRSKTGEIIGAVGLARDVTELRQLEARQAENTAQMEVQQRLLEHREMERQQLARDLHDGPIQSLGGLGFSLQIAQNVSTEAEVKAMLAQMAQEVKNLAAELRGVCNELRPPVLSRFGLKQAIEAHAEEFQSKHPEIQLKINCTEERSPLPDKYVLALYRIYQEALNNVVRHSQASEVLVQLIFSPRHIIFQIKDNGKGFSTTLDWVELARHNHFGLVGMKERAEVIGGKFYVSSSPDTGTMIEVSVPLEQNKSV